MIRTSAHLFEIASRFVSTEETRYYLTGVLVEPHPCGGVNLVATDGHRLMVIYDARGEAESPAIVRLGKVALKACKPTAAEKKANEARTLAVQPDGTALISDSFACLVGTDRETIVDGTFPDYRRCIPNISEASGAPGAFSSAQLATFGDAGSDMMGKKTTPMTMRGTSAGAPHVVTWDYLPNAFGVIMPMRVEDDGQIPAFFNARPFDTPEAEIGADCQHHEPPKIVLEFTVTRRTSPIGPEVRTTYSFATTARAIRVFNRVLASLKAKGQCGAVQPFPRLPAPHEIVWERWARLDESAALERAARLQQARDVFEAATDADLARPWRLALVDGPDKQERNARIRRLRDVSEAQTLAAAYGVAA